MLDFCLNVAACDVSLKAIEVSVPWNTMDFKVVALISARVISSTSYKSYLLEHTTINTQLVPVLSVKNHQLLVI